MNGEWFGASPKARRHSLFLLIERDQIHVANTGYDRITFAAIIVNSRDAVGPPPRHMSFCFSFLGLVLSGIEFEYEAVRKKYGRQRGTTRAHQGS